jgi:exodeoxyribonuclease III
VRLVCWNHRGRTDAKWDLLIGLRPDVAVLPETARAPARASGSLLEPAPSWHWVGSNPVKGLAVATFGVASGVVAPEVTGRWSVAARTASLTVLGVWSCPSDGHYVREVQRALDAHRRWLDPEADVVVAGDFNVDGRAGRRAALFRQLASMGLYSAYHTVRHEEFGSETAPTYYHHRNRARPFHIDFCFVSAPLRDRLHAVEVGTFEDWIEPGHSDHVPLVVDFGDDTPAR